MPKPLVDRLEGLAPAVAIEQQNPTVSSRSTVGTATEIYDYLRLLWARVGATFCRVCGAPVRRDTPQAAADRRPRRSAPGGCRSCFPLPASARHSHAAIVENLRALGFVRLLVDGAAAPPRGTCRPGSTSPRSTTSSSSWTACRTAPARTPGSSRRSRRRSRRAKAWRWWCTTPPGSGSPSIPSCSQCDTPARAPTPALFSFNNPRGACATCNGFGAVLEYDESLIVPDPSARARPTAPSIRGPSRATRPGAGSCSTPPSVSRSTRSAPGPASRRPTAALLLTGKSGRYVGIFPFLKGLEEKRYKQYIRVFLRQYQLALTCPDCHGTRLNAHALAVRIGGETIAEVAARPVDELRGWLGGLALTPQRAGGGAPGAGPARGPASRTSTTSASATSRSTARRGRSRAARPSASPWPTPSARSWSTRSTSSTSRPSASTRGTPTACSALLRRLRDLGNTVVVVEHDLAAIRQADFMLELGPGAGERGGQVVHAGPPSRRARTPSPASTSPATKRIAVPSARRPAGPPGSRCAAPRCTTCATWTSTSRSAR